MQTIVFHRGGFCFAKFISGWFKSLRTHTRIHIHRKKGGDRVLRQIRTVLGADCVDYQEHTLRNSIVADFALQSSFLDGSNRCEPTREFTFTERRAATVSCAKSARCSVQILLIIENTRSEFALLCGMRKNVFISFEIVEYLWHIS